MTKTNPGNFFEDFEVGREIVHATPRTVTTGDVALYGSRFAVQSSDEFARGLGYPRSPIDDMLVFHIVFGKTVPDISLNAIANLGYAECRFLAPVYPGDTLSSRSTVIGVKENTNGKSGIVWVSSTGINQRGETVLDFVRWVMVNKRNPGSPAPEPTAPHLSDCVAPETLSPAVPRFEPSAWDDALSGAPHRFEDFSPGERIDHVNGFTIEDAEHQMATRLYQNTAKVHFDAHAQAGSRFGKRLVYGGHIISIARALSFNGLANAFRIAAINGGRHVTPAFAGDTVYAWTEVVDVAELKAHPGLGALRLRTVATKNHPCADFPGREGDGFQECVMLELDYWALAPRR
jgi:2-methylfumaryl-CoA hydratase